MNKFQELKEVLSLDSDPIGVKLNYNHNDEEQEQSRFKEVDGLRGYCEYIKKVSQGEFLKIRKGDFSCHTGNVILGFEKPESLELTMKLDSKGLKNIFLFPINKYILDDYDCIILVLKPNNCLNIIQAYVKLYKKLLKITCGAINGVCSEVTAHVIKRNEVNFSFLCPDSRRNGLFNECELLCGIPSRMTNELIDEIIMREKIISSNKPLIKRKLKNFFNSINSFFSLNII